MNRVLVVDTETGGLDGGWHSLLTVGLVVGDLESGEVVDSRLIKVKWPDYTVDAEALKVNRIDLVSHHEEAVEKEQAWKLTEDFVRYQFFGAKATVLGHNYPFDRLFLSQLGDWESLVHRRFLDTSPMLEALKVTGRLVDDNLVECATALRAEFPVEGVPHDALYDAILTFNVFMRLACGKQRD